MPAERLAERLGLAALSAVCAALAAPVRAAESAPAAPLPVARPADAGAQPTPALNPAANAAAGASSSPREKFRALLRREAARTGLPFDLADAVTAIESGYDPAAIGAVGEIGLMQVRPGTAAMLGFQGDAAELARPEVNVHYGVAYLAGAWRLANGDVCRALMKYRAGHGEEQMSALSAAYCGRARTHLAGVGSALAAGILVPAVADPGPPGVLPGAPRPRVARLPRVRTEAVSRAFWAAHEARIAALTRRIEAKWRKMASR